MSKSQKPKAESQSKANQDQSSPPKKDKSHLKSSFTRPGVGQIQTMLKIGNIPIEAGNIEPIAEGLLERLEETKNGNWDAIELTLHSQINMLSCLSSHLLAKAMGGYSDTTVMATMPQVPGEFLDFSLRCMAEMRKCVQLLHELKNPKKPTNFIKSYVHQQLNSLQIEQQELRDRLEASNYAQMDTRSTPEAKREHQELETLGEFNGTTNGRGQAN